jgi:VWFA-related protein
LAAAGIALAQDFGETLEVNVVTVDVEVRDADGRVVTDLNRGDFRLFEDGKRVDLTNFERVVHRVSSTPETHAPASSAAPPPATDASTPTAAEPITHVVVYVDNVHLHAGNRARALRQVRELLATDAAGERVMVASQTTGGLDVRLPFSSDRAAIAAALAGIETEAAHAQDADHDRITTLQAVIAVQRDDIAMGTPCAPNIADPVRGYASQKRQEVRTTLGRLGLLVNSLAGLPGRKALLYVSDGMPQQPGADLFEVLYQICGGGAATSGAGYTSQPAPVAGGGMDKPNDAGVGVPMLDASALGPGAYRATSAALDAASYDLGNDLHRLAAHASANRVSLYTLQAAGLTTFASADASLGADAALLQVPAVASLAHENEKAPLVLLAQETGGRAIVDTNDFSGELRRMRQNLAAFYSLGFMPGHHGDGKEHRIEVRVDRPGVKLSYRRNYRDKPPLEQTVDRLLAALVHGVEDNPLDVVVELQPARRMANGHYQVTARLLVPLFRLATITHDDFYEGKLRVMVISGEPGGNSSPVRQVEVPLRVPHMQALTAFGQKYGYEVGLELTAGEHVVAFAVRDELGGSASFLRRKVDVKPPVAASTVAP